MYKLVLTRSARLVQKFIAMRDAVVVVLDRTDISANSDNFIEFQLSNHRIPTHIKLCIRMYSITGFGHVFVTSRNSNVIRQVMVT